MRRGGEQRKRTWQTTTKVNTIRPQLTNGEPASNWRSPAAQTHQSATGDTEPVAGQTWVVGGRMPGKDRAVNTGDLPAQERRETAGSSQNHRSSDEPSTARQPAIGCPEGVSAAKQPGNDRGAKDERKEDHQSEGPSEAHSSAVPATGKRDEEALWQRHKAHFDFLGYRFWPGKTSERIRLFIRPKSLKKFREAIKPLTRRTNGQSMSAIAPQLRPRLEGFYN